MPLAKTKNAKTKKRPTTAPAAKPRARFHHGNLREALIQATLELVEEGGIERITVREAARRAGVSSGAPFRHFPNKTALMTAVAEEAMHRFRAEIEVALKRAAAADPLTRFRALGDAYFRWITRNPTHFRIISDRTLVDFVGSESLRDDNAATRRVMEGLLGQAQRERLVRPGDIAIMALAARAIAYGLGRMWIDGHFAQWDVAPKQVRPLIDRIFDLFVSGLAGGEAPAGRQG